MPSGDSLALARHIHSNENPQTGIGLAIRAEQAKVQQKGVLAVSR
jgi:hypothetical protein